MPFIMTFDEFKAKQDCRYHHSGEHLWEIRPGLNRPGYLFENGAFWDNAGGFQDPPTDRFLLARRQRQFFESELAQWENAFAHARQSAELAAQLTRPGYFSPSVVPPEAHLARMKELKPIIDELHDKLDELDEIIAQDPVAKKAREEEAEARAAKSLAHAKVTTEIQSITIPSRQKHLHPSSPYALR